MKLNSLSKEKISWLEQNQSDGIIISTRIRLARNLEDYFFPQRISSKEKEEILKKVKNIILHNNVIPNAKIFSLNELDEIDMVFLVERHLISYEHAKKEKGRGLIVSKDETSSIMVNEEDHLRLQEIQSGLSLSLAWERISKIENYLEKHLNFAFSQKLGYLTACPTNVGTGIRVSLLIHLPGLVWKQEINKVLEALNRLGIVARGFYGEGTKVIGDIFQLSNQVTLGRKEEEIIDSLKKVIKQVVEQEIKAEDYLYTQRKDKIIDIVSRALGTLKYAYKISFAEAMDMFSYIRLGIYLKVITGIKLSTLNELMVNIQPAHLQERVGERLTSSQRDVVRARFIREQLN